MMTPPLPGTVLGFLLLVTLIAGLARGFSGFGSALIFVPLASVVVGPQMAAPLLLVVDGVMTLGMIPPALRLANRHEVATMAVGALIGIPAGVWALTQFDPLVIRWAIVAIVAALLVLLVSGWRFRARPRPALTVGVGLASGLLSGAAQIGGPPVVAYWLGGITPPKIVRANIISYFVVSTVLSAVAYLWGGLMTRQVLVLALILAPAYAAGVWAGSRMFGLASEVAFRRICFAMIAAAAVLSMPVLDGWLG